MPLSTHYYVLALSAETNRLYEAFRDFLIDIHDHGLPLEARDLPALSPQQDQWRELARTVDERFGRFYRSDPLRVVVVGEETLRSAFRAVTAHGDAVIGTIAGDHTATSARDLGQIVWPVVREALSGVRGRALRNLEVSSERGQIPCGLEAVARLAGAGAPTTLLVEEGYRERGSLAGTDHSLFISPDVDVRDALDDAVDAVIEKVLACGGDVVFTPDGSLQRRHRIVLLPPGETPDREPEKRGA